MQSVSKAIFGFHFGNGSSQILNVKFLSGGAPRPFDYTELRF